MKRIILISASCCLLIGYLCVATAYSRPSARSIRQGLAAPLPFGEVKPHGWMLQQLQADLSNGLVAYFPQVNTTTERQRFVLHNATPDNVPHLADDDNQRGWWSGEHEAYYADGYFRTAWLADDSTHIRKATERLNAVLAAQSSDGYIGIYAPEHRLPMRGPDGELWTQSRIFQALLAYYEATGRTEILVAVERAAQLTLSRYVDSTYFSREGSRDGGVSHGIGFSDTLEWLYRLTGKRLYCDGLLWLYADYSRGGTRDLDMILENVANRDAAWVAHTPHTAEGLAMPRIAAAYYGGKNTQLNQAAANTLYKLAKYSNPSGAMVGDESIQGRDGSFDLTAEYCTMTETIGSLTRIAAHGNPFTTADRAELIAFNAAQGARLHPSATAVSYLSRDNRSIIQRSTHGGRELFSASHRAAACCVLNSTRLLPYYIEGMWMKEASNNRLLARLYGPSEVNTELRGVPVHIAEQTSYPFEEEIRFTVTPEKPVRFALRFHIPAYAQKMSHQAPAGMNITRSAEGDYLEVEGLWRPGDEVVLNMNFSIREVADAAGSKALAYGPLLFSLPVPAEKRVIRTFVDGRFEESEYSSPKRSVFTGLALGSAADFQAIPLSYTESNPSPWVSPPVGLSGVLYENSGSPIPVVLKPLGSTLLRMTGFVPYQLPRP